MAIPVLLLLAGLWAVVLVPPLLRARAEQKLGGPDFTARLGVLARRTGHKTSYPSRPLGKLGKPVGPIGPLDAKFSTPMSPMKKRRRDLLVGLMGAVVVTFLAALMANMSLMWLVQLATDALLGGYCFLLVRMKQTSAERKAKVHYLPKKNAPATHLPLRRSASL